MMSRIGRFIHLSKGLGERLSSVKVEEFHSTNPFSCNLAISLLIGVFKISAVVGILLECPLTFRNLLISPFTLEILWISVPRK